MDTLTKIKKKPNWPFWVCLVRPSRGAFFLSFGLSFILGCRVSQFIIPLNPKQCPGPLQTWNFLLFVCGVRNPIYVTPHLSHLVPTKLFRNLIHGLRPNLRIMQEYWRTNLNPPDMPLRSWYLVVFYKTFPPDHFGRVEMKKPTSLSDEPGTARSCAEDQILENKIPWTGFWMFVLNDE